MRDMLPVSLPFLPRVMQVSSRKFTFFIPWSLYELCLEVHNSWLKLRIVEIQLGSDNGFDLHPWWHVITQGWEGGPENACALSLISGCVMRPGRWQSQPRVSSFLVFRTFTTISDRLMQKRTEKLKKPKQSSRVFFLERRAQSSRGEKLSKLL